MTYLVSHYGLWLLLAAGLGLVIGALTSGPGPARWGFLPVVLVAAGLALLASWSRAVNGVPALWIETGGLFLLAYLAGCLVGAWLAGLSADAAAVPAAGPAIAVPASLAPVSGGAGHPGARPAGRAAAQDDTPDDLEIIVGVGPVNARKLNELGIWHFEQIAAWTPDNIAWVGSYLAFPGRIEREDWVGQARRLAEEQARARG